MAAKKKSKTVSRRFHEKQLRALRAEVDAAERKQLAAEIEVSSKGKYFSSADAQRAKALRETHEAHMATKARLDGVLEKNTRLAELTNTIADAACDDCRERILKIQIKKLQEIHET
jgi:hypothetical protein